MTQRSLKALSAAAQVHIRALVEGGEPDFDACAECREILAWARELVESGDRI